jgi:hypothetical protein
MVFERAVVRDTVAQVCDMLGVRPRNIDAEMVEGVVVVMIECEWDPILHSEILMSVQRMFPAARIDVQSTLPRVKFVSPHMKWLRAQEATIEAWYRVALKNVQMEAYGRLIAGYPWRDKASMRLTADHLLSSTEPCHVAQELSVDPVLPQIDVSPEAREEVREILRREPASLLEMYEVVYALGRTEKTKYLETYFLFLRLFEV